MQLERSGGAGSSDDAFIKMRRENIRADIAKRLRNICSHFSEAEFRQLVEAMAEKKLKGERRAAL